MESDLIKISKSEYLRLKELEKVEWDVVGDFKQALTDLDNGNYKEI